MNGWITRDLNIIYIWGVEFFFTKRNIFSEKSYHLWEVLKNACGWKSFFAEVAIVLCSIFSAMYVICMYPLYNSSKKMLSVVRVVRIFVRFNIWKTVTTFVYSATQYCCVSINEICVQAARFHFYFLLDIIFWLSSKFLADNSGDFFATRRAFNQYLFITRPPLNPK